MKVTKAVEDIYPRIRKDEKIKHVLNTMYKAGVDRVIVLKNSNTLYGIATEWDIFFKLSMLKKVKYRPYDLSLSSVTTYPVETLDPSAEIKTSIEIFLVKGFSSIPIIDRNNIYGLVTKKSILNLFLDNFKELDIKAKDVMKKVKGKVEPFNSLKNVENKFRLGGFNTLIVHSNGKYIGIITTLDLARILFQIRKLHPTKEWGRYIDRLSAADITRRDIEILRPDYEIYKAAEILAEGRQKVIPIVEDGYLRGIITRRHLLEIIKEKFI